MSRAQRLYQLQQLDSEVDGARKELAVVAAKLADNQAVQQAEQAEAAAQSGLRKAHTTMQDLDLEVKSLTEKIERQEKLLYSGKALSAKEAANLQDEVSSLKKWREKREELLLEAMVAQEEAEAGLEQAQATLATTKDEAAARDVDLVQNQQGLEQRVAELLEQRESVVKGIAAADLTEYEKLRKKKAGTAVSIVRDGVCQGCYMAPSNSKLQQARAGTDLVYCGACGRILYAP